MDKWIGIESPRWMRISLYILKCLVTITPMVICSIYFLIQGEMSMTEEWLWTCVYILSCLAILNMTNE